MAMSIESSLCSLLMLKPDALDSEEAAAGPLAAMHRVFAPLRFVLTRMTDPERVLIEVSWPTGEQFMTLEFREQ